LENDPGLAAPQAGSMPRRSHRRMMVDGIDLDTSRELDETSDEPWCYRSRNSNRRFINAETEVSSWWANRINLS
jgi:hypothetical protein